MQTDDPILGAFANAVARGVRVRAIIEPCPGGTCTTPDSDAMTGCEGLLRAVVRDFNRVFQQYWQNGDPLKNCLELPAARPAANGVQSYEQLIVSPDHGREQILGFIASAKKSLKIQVEQIDPQNGRGIVPALVAAIKRGVQLQLLLSQPADQTSVQEAADAINLAGGLARFQSGLKPHAKMMIADGARMFTGSQNLTQDSLDLRREIGWIVSDESAIACFQQVFDADWSARPSVSGICQSAQPASLAGTSVQVRDSAGVVFSALLTAATPSQVNALVPTGLAAGPAQFTVKSSDGRIALGTHYIATVAPGLFSANSSGSGLAAGLVQIAG